MKLAEDSLLTEFSILRIQEKEENLKKLEEFKALRSELVKKIDFLQLKIHELKVFFFYFLNKIPINSFLF